MSGSSLPVLLSGLLCLCACAGPESTQAVVADLEIRPPAAVAGEPVQAFVTVREADGTLVRGATLELEAHMNHPGMAPIVADFTEDGDGAYTAPVPFTMAGDWTVVVSGSLPDGRRITQTQSLVVGASGSAPAGAAPSGRAP